MESNLGRVQSVIGLLIEVHNIEAHPRYLCYIYESSQPSEHRILAEVVGIKEEIHILMPLENSDKIRPGCAVEVLPLEFVIKRSGGRFGRVKTVVGSLIEVPGINASCGRPCFVFESDVNISAFPPLVAKCIKITDDSRILQLIDKSDKIRPGCLVEALPSYYTVTHPGLNNKDDESIHNSPNDHDAIELSFPDEANVTKDRCVELLVVDDDARLRRLIEYNLSDRYNINLAANGKVALRRLQEKHIDLIISDIEMPLMDGLTLYMKLRLDEETRYKPFIFATASSKNLLPDLSNDSLANCISTPFDFNEDLVPLIERLLQHSANYQSINDNEVNNNQKTNKAELTGANMRQPSEEMRFIPEPSTHTRIDLSDTKEKPQQNLESRSLEGNRTVTLEERVAELVKLHKLVGGYDLDPKYASELLRKGHRPE